MNFAEELRIIADIESAERKKQEIISVREQLSAHARRGGTKTILGLKFPELTIPDLEASGLNVCRLPLCTTGHLPAGQTYVEVSW